MQLFALKDVCPAQVAFNPLFVLTYLTVFVPSGITAKLGITGRSLSRLNTPILSHLCNESQYLCDVLKRTVGFLSHYMQLALGVPTDPDLKPGVSSRWSVMGDAKNSLSLTAHLAARCPKLIDLAPPFGVKRLEPFPRATSR